jgi:hypothetical protein
MAEIDQLRRRVEVLEEMMETMCRPLADLLPPERIQSIERTGYENRREIAAIRQTAAEALSVSRDMLNSRIWQALVKGSSFLQRLGVG